MLTNPDLHRLEVGVGKLHQRGERLRLVNAPTSDSVYTNAQIDDYEGLPRRDFPWQPRPGQPVVLSLRARFSHERLAGTAGFGFWNDPSISGGGTHVKRAPALPKALWFFYASPESNLPLAMDVAGHGWKAQTFDAQRPLFYALAPAAPAGVLLMRVPQLYRRLWPMGQRALGVSEAMVGERASEGNESGFRLSAWHDYRIEWGVERARFFVDEHPVLDCDTSPKGPLGLVIWLDNQAMVLTPQGRFRHAVVACEHEQWLEVKALTVRRI